MLDQLRALRVLTRSGMIEPLRPDRAVHAARAIRRYGAFGGLLATPRPATPMRPR